jgi:hypothetical protein
MQHKMALNHPTMHIQSSSLSQIIFCAAQNTQPTPKSKARFLNFPHFAIFFTESGASFRL